MAKYKISEEAKDDLIRIHQFGIKQFGQKQADKYFYEFFDYFEKIAENPFAYESISFIRDGYRRCTRGSDSIYFRLNKETIEIMAIIGRQDLENLI